MERYGRVHAALIHVPIAVVSSSAMTAAAQAIIVGPTALEVMGLSSTLPVSAGSAEENGARRRVDMPGTHIRQAISAAHVGDTIIVVFIVLGRKNCGETGPARVTGRR